MLYLYLHEMPAVILVQFCIVKYEPFTAVVVVVSAAVCSYYSVSNISFHINKKRHPHANTWLWLLGANLLRKRV